MTLMTLLACAALLAGIFVYVFYPQSKTEEQTQKTRLEFLRERKETIYENLRDLNFDIGPANIPRKITWRSGRVWKTKRLKFSPKSSSWKPLYMRPELITPVN